MGKIFKADEFTPTKWDTAEDKLRFAEHFVRFVQSDFKRSLFYKWFYRRLMLMFGHIAHFDIHGFWSTFFESPADTVNFISHCLQHPCYGKPDRTHCDVEKVLQQWMREHRILEAWKQKAAADFELRERAELDRLQEKYK